MKKLLIAIIVFLAITEVADAQRWKRYRYELNMGLGISNCFTDLGGANRDGSHFFRDMEFSATRPAVVVGARYRWKELTSFKFNLILGWAKASDAWTTSPGRANRAASSSSPIFENSLVMEYSLTKERYGTRYTFRNWRRFSLKYVNTFVYLGVGGFYFSPKGDNLNFGYNRTVAEGDNFFKYNLAFPLGIGFKYGVNRYWTFEINMGHRYTTTDYLDGMSDTHTNARDSYLFLIFNLNYKLRTARSGLPKF